MAKRANQPTVLFSPLVKSNWNVPKEQVANNEMQHAYSNEECQMPISKQKNTWQYHVLGKWNICSLEIAISDSDEYVFACGQLDSV